MKILIPVPLGELIDKLTILNLKLVAVKNPVNITNVARERDELFTIFKQHECHADGQLAELTHQLSLINRSLWGVQDRLRELEAEQDFGLVFVQLARSAYKLNDQRSRLKNIINGAFQSELIEVKLYKGC